MNNSIYGKTIGKKNKKQRNRLDGRLRMNIEDHQKSASEPGFVSPKIFSKNLV